MPFPDHSDLQHFNIVLHGIGFAVVDARFWLESFLSRGYHVDCLLVEIFALKESGSRVTRMDDAVKTSLNAGLVRSLTPVGMDRS